MFAKTAMVFSQDMACMLAFETFDLFVEVETVCKSAISRTHARTHARKHAHTNTITQTET